MIIFIKLLLAHLLGDFLLQPHSWVQEKENKRLKSNKLYFHTIIHFLLAYLLLGEWKLWKVALAVSILHFCIDVLKISLQKESNRKIWFFIDQALHILSIILIGIIFKFLNISTQLNNNILITFTFLFFITFPTSLFIKNVINTWNPITETEKKESLQNAGKFIGFLERILIFIFILTNHFDAVGFLLAAKSVFRYGDLNESKERNLTEYVLIGTLLSFGIAIISALATQYLLLNYGN